MNIRANYDWIVHTKLSGAHPPSVYFTHSLLLSRLNQGLTVIRRCIVVFLFRFMSLSNHPGNVDHRMLSDERVACSYIDVGISCASKWMGRFRWWGISAEVSQFVILEWYRAKSARKVKLRDEWRPSISSSCSYSSQLEVRCRGTDF